MDNIELLFQYQLREQYVEDPHNQDGVGRVTSVGGCGGCLLAAGALIGR